MTDRQKRLLKFLVKQGRMTVEEYELKTGEVYVEEK
jgi:hypothetical protein